MRKFLEKYGKKLTIAGAALVGLGVLGLCIAELGTEVEYTGDNRFGKLLGYAKTYKYAYLYTPAAIALCMGFLAICPALLKIVVAVIKWLWSLVQKAIYEVCFAATSGIKDGKRGKGK